MWSHTWLFVAAGLSGGGAYALTALGIVAVYRGSSVLNFGQCAMGMIGVYAFWGCRHGEGMPLVPALAVGLAAGALSGALFYVLVIRHIRFGSDTTKTIATLGLLLLITAIGQWRFGLIPVLTGPIIGNWGTRIFGAYVSEDTIITLILTFVVAIGLWAMFKWTRLGARSTALSESPVAAASLGISPHPTGVAVWTLGGVLATLAGIFLLPLTGLSVTNISILILPAMAAGLLGRFRWLSLTVVGGIGIGVLSSVLLNFNWSPEVISSLPFAIVIIVLVFRSKALPTRGSLQALRLPRVTRGLISWRKAVFWLVVLTAAPFVLPLTWAEVIISSATIAILSLSAWRLQRLPASGGFLLPGSAMTSGCRSP